MLLIGSWLLQAGRMFLEQYGHVLPSKDVDEGTYWQSCCGETVRCMFPVCLHSGVFVLLLFFL